MSRNTTNKGFFRKAFDRLIEARARQANAYVAEHAQWLDHESRAAFYRNNLRKNS